jgi:hypothetical protein
MHSPIDKTIMWKVCRKKIKEVWTRNSIASCCSGFSPQKSNLEYVHSELVFEYKRYDILGCVFWVPF